MKAKHFLDLLKVVFMMFKVAVPKSFSFSRGNVMNILRSSPLRSLEMRGLLPFSGQLHIMTFLSRSTSFQGRFLASPLLIAVSLSS